MTIEIKHRFTGEVLYACEADGLRAAVVMAVESGADLAGADLAGAYLAGADLAGANLAGAAIAKAEGRTE